MSQTLQTAKEVAVVTTVSGGGIAAGQGAWTAETFNNIVILGGTVGFWITVASAIGAIGYAAMQAFIWYKTIRKELNKE